MDTLIYKRGYINIYERGVCMHIPQWEGTQEKKGSTRMASNYSLLHHRDGGAALISHGLSGQVR